MEKYTGKFTQKLRVIPNILRKNISVIKQKRPNVVIIFKFQILFIGNVQSATQKSIEKVLLFKFR